MIYVLIAIAILPVLILLKYVNGKDIDKEPKGLRAKLFFLGMLSIIPTIFIESSVSSLFPLDGGTVLGMVFNTFMGVGLVEELVKFYVAYVCTAHHVEFDHRYDAIVYCVYATLGFAFVENLFFVLQEGLGTGILRALLAVPSHACDAIIVGYFYGLYKENKVALQDSKAFGYLILGIFIASLEHAIYDGLILYTVNQMTNGIENYKYFGIVLLMVITTYIVCIIILKKVSKIDTNFDKTKAKREKSFVIVDKTHINASTCPYCGTTVRENFCPNCGAKRE